MKSAFSDNFYANFLPVSEEETRWDLYLTGVGHENSVQDEFFSNERLPEIYRMSRRGGRMLPEYVFVYSRLGTATYFSTKTDPILLRPGAFYVLFPGIWHSLSPGAEGWSEWWFTCNGPYLHSLVQHGVLDPLRPVFYPNAATTAKARAIMEQIIRTVSENPSRNDPRYAVSIMEYLITLYPDRKPPSDRRVDQHPHSAARLVESACKEIWNWSRYEVEIPPLAKKLGVSRRTLERAFRQVQGHSIREEVHRCRLFRACSLLRETTMKIEQVALMAGFPGYDHMKRVFQRFLNQSPGEYRRGGE